MEPGRNNFSYKLTLLAQLENKNCVLRGKTKRELSVFESASLVEN